MTEQEWFASNDPAALLHCLTAQSVPGHVDGIVSRVSDRKLRLFACACCRQVWHLLTDDVPCEECAEIERRAKAHTDSGGSWDTAGLMRKVSQLCEQCKGTGRINRSRAAVEVAERFADGLATADELEAAEEAARSSWQGSDNPAGAARYCCIQSASHAAQCIARPQMMDLPAPANLAALLREVVGNPFRPVILPGWDCCVCGRLNHGNVRECAGPDGTGGCGGRHPWLTPTVLSLAQAAYDERPGRKCEWCPKWEGVGTDAQGYYKTDAVQAVINFGKRKKACACGGTGHVDDGSLNPLTLAALADALEEAGCTGEAILAHLRSDAGPCPRCRGKGHIIHDDHLVDSASGLGRCRRCSGRGSLSLGPHVRGCWSLDLILGLS